MRALAVKLQEFEKLDLMDLRARWQQCYATEAPATISRELLRLAVGYKMQEDVSGGLSRRTLLQLSTIKMVSGTRSLSDVSGRVPAPRSGTKLIREWQGRVHEVLALEDGQFAYGGKTYRSLTKIARQITGTHQSGPRFAYRPFALKGDVQLESDFAKVRQILDEADPQVRTGDLHEAHLTLEKVRPVFQEMFKRNGFSLLSVALVDFHDAMETILTPAAAKDTAGVISIYPTVSSKLATVEAEQNDAEIQDIRKALEELLANAQSGNAEALPDNGTALKTSFVKVYLKRG